METEDATLEVPQQHKEQETTSIMPPAYMMNADPFAQFGQLSLDHTDPNKPMATAPATPPQDSKPSETSMNAPVMQTGYQQYPTNEPPQQQQPMQVSPDQAITLVNPGQQANAYANYQYNQQFQQPVPQMQQQPYPNGNLQGALTSPPVSPPWNGATSPGQTPPDVANNIQQVANTAMMPSMPAVFGNAAPAQAGGVPVPHLSPSSPVAAVSNPFDTFGAAPPPAQAPPPADPFAGNNAVPAPQQPQVVQNQEQGDADFWNNMGFGAANNNSAGNKSPGNVTPSGSFSSVTSDTSNSNQYQDNSLDNHDDAPVTLDDRGLPAGGEYYKARITTPMLGAIFSSGKELRSTLYKTASSSFVEAIGDRPVISFTIDGSAADTAGISLGHILLKVNDQEIGHTDDAVKTVGSAKRPMVMEFYIPNKLVKVATTQAQCMVKYDNNSTEAPKSQCEWKPKYVVVGDMLGKPHILYMYRSKVSYNLFVASHCFFFYYSIIMF